MRRLGAVLLLFGCAVACRKSPAGSTLVGADAGTPTPDPDRTTDAAAPGDAPDGGGIVTPDAGGPADVASAGDTSAVADAAPVPVPLTRMQPCRLLGIGQPTAMDLSPDGRLAVFGNSIGGVTIVEMSGFSALRTITAHTTGLGAVAFSPDSARVASGDTDGQVALWDVATGAGGWAVTGLRGPIQALAFSPSGTLWALTPDGLVALNAADGTHGTPAQGTSARAAAFSEDAATIVLGQTDGSFRLLRAADRSTLATVAAAHPGGVTALRISANGNRIASGGADGTVALWDAQGNLVRRIARPGKPVASVDVNADGLIVIVGASSYASALRADGSLLVEYIIFPEYARLSKDGAFLVQMTHAWRADLSPIDPQNPNRGNAWSDSFDSAAFSPDGRLLAEGVFNVVHLWDTQTGERVRTLDTSPQPFTPPSAIAFSPDGVNLARNTGDDSVRVRRVSDDALVATYRGAKPWSRSLAFSPDGAWLATPGPTAVALWRTSDGTSGPTGFVGRAGKLPTAVAFSKDGASLAVGDAGGGVSIWAFPSGAPIGQFASLSTPVDRIAFSPDGSRVIVSDFYGFMALHAFDGTEVGDMPRAYASSFSFSSDGQYLATVGAIAPAGTTEDGIRLSSPATGLPVMRVGPAVTGDYLGSTSLVAFAPTGHRLAVTGNSSARLFCLP